MELPPEVNFRGILTVKTYDLALYGPEKTHEDYA
jgi:hypothetical protein